MARTEIETGRVVLIGGIELVSITVNGTYYNDTPYTYDTYQLDGLSDHAVIALAEIATILKNTDDEDVIDYLKDYARDLAEDAELPFTYEDSDGDVNTYTPASLWESSGGCEWDQSAQEGYDYGWNI